MFCKFMAVVSPSPFEDSLIHGGINKVAVEAGDWEFPDRGSGL